MKIIVSGQDRTDALDAEISAKARELERYRAFSHLSPEHSALSLKQCTSDTEFLGKFLELTRMRQGVRTVDFAIPIGPGWKGAVMGKVKSFLWRLLRYQHDRIAFQQNLINEHTSNAVSFQETLHQREIAELKARIEALEKRSGASS